MFEIFFLFFGLASAYAADVISIKQGTLEGVTLTARHGKLFNAYFGIPFAEPPVGKLRFQPPLEDTKQWIGILNATTISPICVQINKLSPGTSMGIEDCLYLNVYTPLNVKPGDNLPVLFYIYGGIFKTGSNVVNGPEYIMEKDIIMVHANYRGGALGFLSTGDTVISGNFALKDQVLALKWTRQNIYAFGGDANRVTLHGHSSGAMSVHLHTLSPLSKGLFHRAIMQSGVGCCSTAYFGTDVSKSIAKEFAQRLGCSTKSSQEMLSCFLELEPETFALVPEQMHIWNDSPDAIFRPTVEDKNVVGAFLTEDPHKAAYQSTAEPWIIGMTSKEASVTMPVYLANNGKLLNVLNDAYKQIFPIILQYLWSTKKKHLNYVSRSIRTRYFKNENISTNTVDNLVDMFTDGLYGVCIVEAVRKYAGKKYVYIYDHVTAYSKLNKSEEEYFGVGHADELELIFQRLKSAPYLNEADITMGDEMITRWINFVYSGNPNQPFPINENLFSPWEPMVSKHVECLRIKFNGSMETDSFERIYDFWKRLPIGNKYY